MTSARPQPPADASQVRAEIERTREELGATVEQLTAKVDVKSRARAQAAQLTWRVKSSTVQAREQAARGARTARQNRLPLVLAAASLTAGTLGVCLAIWQRRSRCRTS